MDTSQLLMNAKDSLDSFSLWLSEEVKPLAEGRFPLEFDSWCKELSLIRGLVERPTRPQIALVGTTGAGKSTLLNAILGHEVLPVGVMHPCTAFVTSVSYSSEAGYWVEVEFCTRDEWQEDLKSFAAALRPGEPEEDGDGRNENRRLMEAARKRIKAVYDLKSDEMLDPDTLMTLRFSPEVEDVFLNGASRGERFEGSKDMLTFLKRLIRDNQPLWPLIKKVNVKGPYACLESGLELIDLPGVNDPNEARVEVTREFLRTSTFVWVIFSMVRGLTEDIQRILKEEKLLRALVLNGSYDALSLVGTKADDIDTNIADQLGLEEDCSQEDLIKAYCRETVKEARVQLEQMVYDLAAPSDVGSTLDRMVEMARRVRVHTTSANAYNKIKGIVRLRRDFGLVDENDTGIPAVHQHLSEIGRDSGALFNGRMALKRLDQLGDEISFFFRAREKAPTPEVGQAHNRLPQERDAFSRDIQGVHSRANDELESYRARFLEKMDPLFAASVQGVKQTIAGWRGIHWATLRAIVQRNGVFMSSTGRMFDLNEDLAEPLLQQLPVSWEKYFTDDVGGVTDKFVLRVTESGKNFCGRVRLIIELLLNQKNEGIEAQLAWFQDKVSLLAQAAKDQVLAKVKECRSELAAKMPLVALSSMKPSYDVAKQESGRGMKQRILDHLEPTAIASAPPIYETIRQDLLDGLNNLEIIIVGMFSRLMEAAIKQVDIVVDNANIDVEAAAVDPVISDLIKSIPRRTDLALELHANEPEPIPAAYV